MSHRAEGVRNLNYLWYDEENIDSLYVCHQFSLIVNEPVTNIFVYIPKTSVSYSRNFDFLIPDAPELISNFLEGEQDMSCKRNAFMMLIHADQERALTYLSTCIDQVNSFGDILQLVIVELIYKVRKIARRKLLKINSLMAGGMPSDQ